MPKASDPAAYNPKKVAKYAILMTDGEFNTAFAGVPERRADDQLRRQCCSRAYAEQLCDEMKKDGIEIFTVGFMLKEAGAKAGARRLRLARHGVGQRTTTRRRAAKS